MLKKENFEFTDDFWCIGFTTCTVFKISIASLLIILSLSIFILYPFYFLAFRKNRKRDEMTSSVVFSILKHFYHMVNFMETLYLVDIVAIIGCIFVDVNENLLYLVFVGSFLFFTLTFTLVITLMENLMLSILAIYRFSIYFFPQTENFLTKSLKIFRKTVIFIYILTFLANFLQRLIKFYYSYWTFKKSKNYKYSVNSDFEFFGYSGHPSIDFFDKVNQSIHIFLTGFQFFSAFLYVPILLSVRKKTGLQSAKTSQPEKYILYQTFFIVIFRMSYIPYLVYSFMLDKRILPVLFFGLTIVDICVTHFIIQASYLSCNKKHVESLLNMLGCNKNKVGIRYRSAVESTTMAT